MSRENVEAARRGYDAAVRHDTDAVLDEDTEDAEWHMRGPWLEDPVYRGRHAIRDFLESWFATFGEQTFLLDEFEYVEAGERIVVVGKQHIGASGGGPAVDQEFGQLLTFREGKIARSDLRERPRGPRSRWPLGVGDVAGERGGRSADLRGLGAGPVCLR